MNRLSPITPGELLQEEFLEPLGISQYRLAKSIGVPASRISEIVTGQRAITADTDRVLLAVLLFPAVVLGIAMPVAAVLGLGVLISLFLTSEPRK